MQKHDSFSPVSVSLSSAKVLSLDPEAMALALAPRASRPRQVGAEGELNGLYNNLYLRVCVSIYSESKREREREGCTYIYIDT